MMPGQRTCPTDPFNIAGQLFVQLLLLFQCHESCSWLHPLFFFCKFPDIIWLQVSSKMTYSSIQMTIEIMIIKRTISLFAYITRRTQTKTNIKTQKAQISISTFFAYGCQISCIVIAWYEISKLEKELSQICIFQYTVMDFPFFHGWTMVPLGIWLYL